jgi:hypothetical protein
MTDRSIEDLITINAVRDEYVCVTCHETIGDVGRIAILIRHGPGKPMDPLCVKCAHDLVTAAATQLASEEEAWIFIN